MRRKISSAWVWNQLRNQLELTFYGSEFLPWIAELLSSIFNECDDSMRWEKTTRCLSIRNVFGTTWISENCIFFSRGWTIIQKSNGWRIVELVEGWARWPDDPAKDPASVTKWKATVSNNDFKMNIIMKTI